MGIATMVSMLQLYPYLQAAEGWTLAFLEDFLF